MKFHVRKGAGFSSLLCLSALLLTGLSGCATSGWGEVAAWEKGRLAHPGMSFNSDPLDQRWLQHVHASKENANGGSGVGGGGCGCN
jgi:hypothetical protein